MAARLRQQRGVVALRLVGVGARQVEELRPADVEQARTREILARRDHLVGGVGVREVLGLVDQNDPAGHLAYPFRTTTAALSRSLPTTGHALERGPRYRVGLRRVRHPLIISVGRRVVHEDVPSIAAKCKNPMRPSPGDQLISRNQDDRHAPGIECTHQN